MTNRIQMDDIQYRLEVTKKELCDGGIEEGRLLELLEDCRSLRCADPEGPYAEALGFIESMLSLVRSNISNVKSLRRLTRSIFTQGPSGPAEES